MTTMPGCYATVEGHLVTIQDANFSPRIARHSEQKYGSLMRG